MCRIKAFIRIVLYILFQYKKTITNTCGSQQNWKMYFKNKTRWKLVSSAYRVVIDFIKSSEYISCLVFCGDLFSPKNKNRDSDERVVLSPFPSLTVPEIVKETDYLRFITPSFILQYCSYYLFITQEVATLWTNNES